MSGSKHIEFLLEKALIAPKPSKILDELYSKRTTPSGTTAIKTRPSSTSDDPVASEETLILHHSDGQRISEALKIPELNVELDRAVWQVKRALDAEKELQEEKAGLDAATGESQEKK